MAQKSMRVVYIEDEQEMIDLIRLVLKQRGYEVIGANGGREGLEIIRREIPDLVLLDIMMPDMDGWEVFQQIRADDGTKDIPVIFVTAKDYTIDKVLALNVAGAQGFIGKPFHPNELLERIEDVMGQYKATQEG